MSIAHQIPADVAHCLTVHRVQGMTLGAVIVDMTQPFFAPGMTYVALSRAQTLDNLHIVGWDPAQVRIPPYFTELWRTILKVDVLNPSSPPDYSSIVWPKQPALEDLNFGGSLPYVVDGEDPRSTGPGTDQEGIPLGTCVGRPLVCTRHEPPCKSAAACATKQWRERPQAAIKAWVCPHKTNGLSKCSSANACIGRTWRSRKACHSATTSLAPIVPAGPLGTSPTCATTQPSSIHDSEPLPKRARRHSIPPSVTVEPMAIDDSDSPALLRLHTAPLKST